MPDVDIVGPLVAISLVGLALNGLLSLALNGLLSLDRARLLVGCPEET